MALQMNKAVLLLGAPNTKSLVVSPYLKDIGIDLLRRVPSEANILSIPDKVQPRYPLYKGLIPHFLASFVLKKRIPLGSQGISNPYKGDILPLPLPDLIMSWTVPVADEVIDELRTKHNALTATAMGKPALLIPVYAMSLLPDLAKYKPNPIAPCVENAINLSAYRQLNGILRIISGFLKLHSYPAWSDPEHYSEFTKHYDDADSITDMADLTGTTIFGASPVPESKDYGTPTIVYKGPPAPEDAIGWITALKNIPNTFGLFVPYIRELHHFDYNAVPRLIELYFMKSLGDTSEDILDNYRDFRSAWGIIAKTEIGIMLSVIAICIHVGLSAQARILPYFGDGGNFLGVILSGAGYTVELEKVAYRPVPFADLQKVVKENDRHVVALGNIGKLLGTKEAQAKAVTITSMVALRDLLRSTWTVERSKEMLLQYAKHLNFDERPWGINPSTIDRALSLIQHTTIPLDGCPIHYTMLLEEKRSHVVWSCFGGMAPTFRIPNSRPMSLEGPMQIVQRGRDGKKLPNAEVTKVACRNVVLEIALKDLDEMVSKREILNPFGAPNQRASQMNQDRFFSGDDAKRIIAGLRNICGVSASDLASGKRKAEGSAGDEPTRKRPAGFDDF